MMDDTAREAKPADCALEQMRRQANTQGIARAAMRRHDRDSLKCEPPTERREDGDEILD